MNVNARRAASKWEARKRQAVDARVNDAGGTRWSASRRALAGDRSTCPPSHWTPSSRASESPTLRARPQRPRRAARPPSARTGERAAASPRAASPCTWLARANACRTRTSARSSYLHHQSLMSRDHDKLRYVRVHVSTCRHEVRTQTQAHEEHYSVVHHQIG